MATYSTNPRKFRNGQAYGDEKAREEAGRAKRRANVHVIRDTWRRDHPRKIDTDTKGREDSSDTPQREQQDAPQP